MGHARNYLFTSESVTEGHPDKIADQISDAVLDAVLAQDPRGRVACETVVTTGLVFIAGEITSNATVEYPQVARKTIERIGYKPLRNAPRVAPLIISAKAPYFIEDASSWPFALRWLGRAGPEFPAAGLFLKATHGYPAGVPGMVGILYAWGDGIAEGVEAEYVHAIDLHPTVTTLLGIDPGVPVDGSARRDLLVPEGF